MITALLKQAEDDLEQAFDYYEEKRSGLGAEMVVEFRDAVGQILSYPLAWQRLDSTYRRHRLHRFPFGIVYRVDENMDRIVIVAVMHLSRKPNWWRRRT